MVFIDWSINDDDDDDDDDDDHNNNNYFINNKSKRDTKFRSRSREFNALWNLRSGAQRSRQESQVEWTTVFFLFPVDNLTRPVTNSVTETTPFHFSTRTGGKFNKFCAIFSFVYRFRSDASELPRLQSRRILTSSITRGVTSSVTSTADIKMVHDMESIHHTTSDGETRVPRWKDWLRGCKESGAYFELKCGRKRQRPGMIKTAKLLTFAELVYILTSIETRLVSHVYSDILWLSKPDFCESSPWTL